MTDESIKKMYANTINVVLDGIDEESINLIKNAYYTYLYDNYRNFDIGNRNIENVIKIFSDLEITKWKDMSIIDRKTVLLSDEVLDDIKFISSLAFKLAEQKVNSRDVNGENMQNTLDEGTANKYIEALNTYLSQVQDFNKQVAEYFVSEGIVDLQFASGITSNMSLRIGRIIK